ncbi:Hypothetical protein POVR2_LOCUS9 [uncultured virus]|nr:Hypothetical protein POVR2_LOCUS9 [uncultured virus]
MNDVLQQVCIRVDDDTLKKMSTSAFWWSSIKSFLSDAHFWYLRTEHLAEVSLSSRLLGADWKYIYYVVRAQMDSRRGPLEDLTPEEITLAYGLDDYDALLILQEIYGSDLWRRFGLPTRMMSSITSPEVLVGLLDIEAVYEDGAHIALITAAELGRAQMIVPLINLLSTDERDETISRAFKKAVANNQAIVTNLLVSSDLISIEERESVVTLIATGEERDKIAPETIKLLTDGLNTDFLYDTLDLAVENNISRVVLVLIDKLQPTQIERSELFYIAHSNNSEDVTVALLEHDISIVSSRRAILLLEQAIDSHLYRLASVLALQVPISISMLQTAAADADMFEMLLSASRSDPELGLQSHLEEFVNLTSGKRGAERVVKALLLHPRVKIEEIHNVFTLKKIAYYIESFLRDRIDGYLWGISLAGGPDLETSVHGGGYEKYALELVAEHDNSPYAQLLSYIVLKRPSSSDLLDWMISRHDPQFAMAANGMHDNDHTLVPFEALLLVVLYPTMTVAEALDQFRDSEQQEIEAAGKLIGAYLGESGILDRLGDSLDE